MDGLDPATCESLEMLFMPHLFSSHMVPQPVPDT